MKRKVVFFALLLSFFLLFFGKVDAQGEAYFYVVPASVSINKDQTVEFRVYVNTGGNKVNTVSAHLVYPTDKLKFISSSFASSVFTGVVEREESLLGILKYTSFVITNYQGPQGLVVELKFQAREGGTAEIDFLDTSGIYLADGTGRNIMSLSSSKNSTITVSETATATSTTGNSNLSQQGSLSNHNLQDIREDEKNAGVVDYTFTAQEGQLPAATPVVESESLQYVLTFILIASLILLTGAIFLLIRKIVKKRQESSVFINQETKNENQ